MKKLLLIVFLCSGFMVFSQKKLITRTGTIIFEASVPSFEEVKAKNESVSCIFYSEKAEIESLVLMKGFRFKVPMMEEHFNQNYIESDIYPKATFKGVIDDFDISKLTTTPKKYTIKGKIKLHGKSKKINMVAYIKKNEAGIDIDSGFDLNVDDFNITIPGVVSKKISKTVNVKIDYSLK